MVSLGVFYLFEPAWDYGKCLSCHRIWEIRARAIFSGQARNVFVLGFVSGHVCSFAYTEVGDFE